MAFAKGDLELQRFLEAVVGEMQPEINASIEKYSSLEYMLPKQ